MSNDLLFVTHLDSPEGCAEFKRLLASLRTFGGELRDAPVLVFGEQDVDRDGDLRGDEQVSFERLEIPEHLAQYPLASKVIAMARAEDLSGGKYRTLTWIDTNCLVVNPPVQYRLDGMFKAALRPVHIRNVGLLRDEPLNDYWRGVCQACGIDDVTRWVTSFVDGQEIRAYYNTHALSIDPGLGLMGEWRETFSRIVRDSAFQARYCGQPRERTFLFQAVLSALLFKRLPEDQIRLLPTTYNYPYNLQASIPAERCARSLGELVTLTYEGRHLVDATDIEVEERYKRILL